MRRVIGALSVALLVGAAGQTRGQASADYTLELTLGSTRVEGMPLNWSASQVLLLGRDGRLWDFPPQAAKNFHKSASYFQSYTSGEIRERVQRELGSKFEVTATGHYLVAHPRGQKDLWGRRFEDLYRNFRHYFNARGFPLREPQFPLVALVFPDQAGFLRYAAGDNNSPRQRMLGYYSPVSNRIALYDTTSGSGARGDWTTNAATIIHEATHQTAFNLGVHNRFAYTPRWVGEGLGTLFEAPGVCVGRALAAERINRDQLRMFRERLAGRPAGAIATMVADDRRFQTDSEWAYAEAWALTFYLVETQGARYAQYLAKTASRPSFVAYGPAERTADFVSVFGDNWAMLEAHFLRFIAALR